MIFQSRGLLMDIFDGLFFRWIIEVIKNLPNFTSPIKRKQALLESNLPGINRWTNEKVKAKRAVLNGPL